VRIEQSRPTVFKLTLHAYELATLMAAARWAAEGATGELSPAAVKRLDALVSDYDGACMGRTQGPEEGAVGNGP
jgi:hypothetical protein